MAAKRFLCSIDLGGNELQNVVFHNLAVAPPNPTDGMGYFDTATDKFMLYFNGQWNDITGRIVSLATNTPAVQIDNTDPANPAIDILDATAINSGLLSAAFYDLLANATDAATADQLVKRDASGNASFNQITAAVVTGLSAPTNASDAVNKAYVDNIAASGVTIKGTIDASTNPNYPAAVVGDAYHVTVAGLIGGASGEQVEVGDLIVAVADNAGGDEATVGGDFIVMQKNIDNATETVAGIIRKATTAEAIAGTEADAAITPATLAATLANYGEGDVKHFQATIGDGTNTAFAITHSLNNAAVQTQVFDAATGQMVETCITNTDADTVTVTFNSAPSTNEFLVVIQGKNLSI